MEPNVTPQDLLAAVSTDDDAQTLGLLRDRLATAADAAGFLDVSYRHLDSPLGDLLLAATEDGLVRIAYAAEDHDSVLDQLGERISPRILRAPARLDKAARQLDDYFAGTRTGFDLPLDLRLTSGFRRQVLKGLRNIAYGHTASYAAVAQQVGNPRAVRAVGSACATNPVPVVVPCHRVIRSDGTLGNYLGGTDAKRTLLRLESNGPQASSAHSQD
jgi:methylated-DNA-[protein]-cysteine S-methyltransferase